MSETLEKITIEKQPDGNWIGRTTKFGKEVEIRDIGPETVLQRIITYGGE